MRNYDLVVVGAGSGGISAAIYAAANGMKVAIIESNQLGGTAVHTGDIEVKLLQRHAKIAKEVQKASEWGFEIAEFTLDYTQLKSKMFAITSEKNRKLNEQLVKYDINLYIGEASIDEEGCIFLNDIKVNTKFILLATGSRTIIPDIMGIEKNEYITETEVYSLNVLPKSLTIIGGGMSAVEIAFSLAPLGTAVTIIERAEDILLNEDIDLRYKLKKQLAKLNVVMLTNQTFIKMHSNFVEIESGEIFHDKLFIACGRRPDYSYIYNSQIEMEQGVVKVNEYFQTSLHQLYALTTYYESAYSPKVAIFQAKKAVNHMLGIHENLEQQIFIRSLNVFPPAATFGMTEFQAKEKFKELVDVLYFTVQNSVDGLIIGESSCLLKLIVEKELNEIIGAVAIGDKASEILEKIAIIVHLEGSLDEVITHIQHDFMHIIQQRKNV